jgi:hypothetical protein
MDSHNLHSFYTGVGTSVSTTQSLPTQTVKDSIKDTFEWKKKCMDALESIGISQLAENIKFRDLYKMLEGRLAYSDYEPDNQVLNRVRELGDSVGIPTFVKHYDFIGIVTRQLVGEWLEQKDDFKVDTVDDISQNEFTRERTQKVREFALNTFNKELELALMKSGIDTNKKDFQSEEERQQYMQMLEQEKAKIMSPAEIEKEMKDWKTKAAEWGEHVIERDQQRFYMDKLDKQEMEDFIVTGRFFRHYYIGYDHYKPERWSPLETFFSRDVTAEFPQDGEYAGRVFYISPSDIIKRYAHLLKPEEIKKINKNYGTVGNSGQTSSIHNWKQEMNNGMFGQVQTIPFNNFYNYDLGLQIQSALDMPMGEVLVDTPDGQQRIPSWLSPMQNQNHLGYRYSSLQREDIVVRKDLLQVTEAYWRSWKRMWFLNYETENGFTDTAIVTDDILPDFIKENGIKKITTKTLKDIQKNLEPNTMYEFWAPEIWKGIKINAGNSFLTDNLYLGIEPLEYQIRGESNIFDVKIPIGGIISNSIAQKMRPFQVGYNICLNQIFNLLEKEIGMFFLFDINFLPSEYKDYGTIEESLEKLRDHAKDIGLVPLDTTKQNMGGANQSMNTFMVQDVSFDKQIKSRIELSEYYFRKALEQIGITPQRLGQATVYETATGVKQGNEASYMQTADIFNSMSVARRKAMELHLAVAQYCQKEYLDVDFVFSTSDGDKNFMHLSDPDFPLRRLGVMPINDPKKRRELETMKQALLNMNTLGNDLLDYAELFSADTMTELVTIGRKGRLEKQKEIESQRQHEQELADKQIQADAAEKDKQRNWDADQNQKDREARIMQEEIQAQGRAADKKADLASFRNISAQTDMALKEMKTNNDIQVSQDKLQSQKSTEQSKLAIMEEQLRLETRKLEQKDRQMNNDRYIAEINKN